MFATFLYIQGNPGADGAAGAKGAPVRLFFKIFMCYYV